MPEARARVRVVILDRLLAYLAEPVARAIEAGWECSPDGDLTGTVVGDITGGQIRRLQRDSMPAGRDVGGDSRPRLSGSPSHRVPPISRAALAMWSSIALRGALKSGAQQPAPKAGANSQPGPRSPLMISSAMPHANRGGAPSSTGMGARYRHASEPLPIGSPNGQGRRWQQKPELTQGEVPSARGSGAG